MDHPPALPLVPLDSTHSLLALFLSLAVLVVLAYQFGLLTRVLGLVGKFLQTTVEVGFFLWRRLLSWAPWPVFLLLVLVLHVLAWHNMGYEAARALLCGLLLLFVGVITCLAYVLIDAERVEVARGFKVLHNPVKGQELASKLVRYGARVGIPLMVVATAATVSGFTLLNQGVYYSGGQHWYTLTQKSRAPGPEAEGSLPAVDDHPPTYPDFLAYTLINLSHVVDLLDIANTYNLTHITYVRQARWPASTLLVLFKTFFTAVLLQQIFAAVRRFKMLGETIQDYWNPHQPIHERAGMALASFGANAVQPLLRSLAAAESLTASQRDEIATILAGMGPATVPILVRHLHHPDEAVRGVAVNALGRLHALEVLHKLVRAVEDQSEIVRHSLVEALGIIASPGTRTLRKRWLIHHSLQVSRRWFGTIFRLKRWLQLEPDRHPVDLVIGTLSLLLGDPVAEVRVKATRALGQFGAEASWATRGLLALVRDPEEAVRCQAAETLGRLGQPSEECLGELRHLLADPSREVRLASVHALGLLGPGARAAVPELCLLLQDPEEDVRVAAADALRATGPVEEQAIPRLVEGLTNPDNLVRAQTAELLGRIGPGAAGAIPALVRALQDVNDRVRVRVTEALGKMGPAAAAAVPQLIHSLEDEDNRVNALAASALAEIGEPALAAVPGLIRALSHINAEVRSEAAKALGKLSPEARGTVAALERASRDENSKLRAQAVLALVEVQAPGERLRPVILAGLADPDPQVRCAAIQALEKDGRADPALVTALLAALDDTSDQVKKEAATALPALAGATPEVVAGLCRLLQDDTVPVQISAALALGKLGKDAAGAGEHLLRAFQTAEASAREHILTAFAKIQPPEALPAFRAGLTDPDSALRKAASAGLLEAPVVPDDVRPLLLEALHDPEDRVKANAAQVLSRLGTIPAEAVPLLEDGTVNLDDAVRLNFFRALKKAGAGSLREVSQRLIEDSNLRVRLEAAEVLLAENPKDERSAAVVLEALADPVPALRTAALEVTRSLGPQAVILRDVLAQKARIEDPELTLLLNQLIAESQPAPAPLPEGGTLTADSGEKPAAADPGRPEKTDDFALLSQVD